MTTIKELQTQLNNKTIDPRTLSPDQTKAMNAMFDKKLLTGYSSVTEMANERDSAKDEIITAAESQRNPDGASNFGYVIGGDLIGTAAVYGMDRKKLMEAAKNAKATENFRASQSKFGRVLGNIVEKTVGKRFKPVTKLFSRTADFFTQQGHKAAKIARSQGAATEVKSIGAGTVGAGLGATYFEYDQYKKGLVSNVLYDLGDISSREIDKMSPYERGQTAVLAEMTNALMWNTGGSALSPIVGKMLKVTGRTVMGLGGKETKAAAKEANELGLPLNAVELTGNKSGVFAKLVNSYPKVIGQIPIISSSILKQRAVQATAMTERVFKNLTRDFGPIFHTHLFGKEIYPTIKKNHRLFRNTINANYEQLLRKSDMMGNPAIIPTNNVKKVVSDILEKRKSMAIPGVSKADADDPVLRLLNQLDELGSYQKELSYISPRQYLGFQENLHEIIGLSASLSKNNKLVPYLPVLRKAMEEDFASIANKNYSQEFIAKNKKLNEDFLAIKQADGDAAAQKFLEKTQTDLTEFGGSLARSNKFFADVVGNLEGQSGLKTALRMYDSELLSMNSLAGLIGDESQVLSKMFNDISNRVVKNGSVEEVLEFKFLLGLNEKLPQGQKFIKTGFKDLAGKTVREKAGQKFTAAGLKEGAKEIAEESDTLFSRFTGRAVTDAFINSFERVNRDKFSYLKGKVGMENITEQNRKEMINKVYDTDFIDKHLPTVTGTSGFGITQKRALKVGETFKQAGGEAAENLMIKDASASRTGVFNYQAFDDALGFSQPGAKDRFVELFGGGTKGAKHYKDFDGVMRALQAKGEASYGDISTFLQRRLQLGGISALGGAGMVMGGLGGTMGIAGSIGLLFGAVMIGRAVMSPRIASDLLEVLTPLQRIEKAGLKNKIGLPFGLNFGLTTPKKRDALVRLTNQLSNDDPTAFEGKYVPEVTEEMLINYLTSGKMIVPNTDEVKPSDINSKFRESFMPKTSAFEKAPIEEKNNLAGLHQGIKDGVERTYANRTLLEQQDVNAAKERGEVVPEQVAEAPVFDPTQLGNTETQPVGTQGQAPVNVPQPPQISYQSVFPNDPLGQMIEERNKLRKGIA